MTGVGILPERRKQITATVDAVRKRFKVSERQLDVWEVVHALRIQHTTTARAEALGVTVTGAPYGYTIARPGAGGTAYLIVINPDMGHTEGRWTVAHELGHIILGHLDKRSSPGDPEGEADQFASELLEEPAAPLDAALYSVMLHVSEGSGQTIKHQKIKSVPYWLERGRYYGKTI